MGGFGIWHLVIIAGVILIPVAIAMVTMKLMRSRTKR